MNIKLTFNIYYMKTTLLTFSILTTILSACAPSYGQVLNDFETGSPNVITAYGADFSIVPNPVTDGLNTSANCGEIRRTTGNWYELIRFATSFNVPANETKYLHVLVRYTSSVSPNFSIRVDPTADNDGNTEIYPSNSYTTPGEWQDIVFVIAGGASGITSTQFMFFADASVNVLNNTDSFAHIDQIEVNNDATPASLNISNVPNLTAKAYPNPTASTWNFNVGNFDTIGMVEVVDVTGKMVLSKNLIGQSTSVDASGLSQGMYFAKLTLGTATQVIKLIKE